MQSTVAIYNTALARLGGHQLERVNSPDDDGAVSTACRTLFPHVVDLALASHAWSFATRRVALARKAGVGAPGYAFRYALPADCLSPLRLEGEGRDHFPPAHILEGADLLTAVESAVLVHVTRLRDPALFPAHFADAVAWGLAADLATAVINDARRQQLCMQKYELALSEAKAADLRRQNPAMHAGPWMEARQ